MKGEIKNEETISCLNYLQIESEKIMNMEYSTIFDQLKNSINRKALLGLKLSLQSIRIVLIKTKVQFILRR